MVAKVATAQTFTSFEYELFEGDPDNLTTVVATSNQETPWIDPGTLKLRHRIGRGPFGDVWLATHHQFTKDYDEFHEVAVKMLYLINEDQIKVLLDMFADLFSKCQGIENVCCLHGISVIGGKACIIMKYYEGSVGDKMARLKRGKLPLSDVLRYCIDLAQGILELHTRGIFLLNLKPFNFLLNENDEAVVGDVGIPYLLFGIPFPNSDMAPRLGSPNYMAPEQWQPEVRGPMSFETDSWGFACSIVEMLTGVQPWCGKSVDEIYDVVVRKQEKPKIPSGLPPPFENVLLGCFEYDSRSRPLMTDILRVLKSSQNAVYSDEEGWTGFDNRFITEKSRSMGYTEWFLSKDHLQVGDTVRSRKPANSCKLENMDVPDGSVVVGLERHTDRDGFVLVRVHGIHDPIRVHASTLERVTNGLAAGDWVCLKEEHNKHSPVGILHSIDRNGSVSVGFIGLETLWKGNSSNQLQMSESYCVGQFVKLKSSVVSPRFKWPRKNRVGCCWATGRISQILPNGCLITKFPGMLTFKKDEYESFLADPAEVEVITFDSCPGMIKKYQHLEDFHWSVRPLVIALGLFVTMKTGVFVVNKIGRSKTKKQQSCTIQQSEGHYVDDQMTSGNPAWLHPSVANILFREGVSGPGTTTGR